MANGKSSGRTVGTVYGDTVCQWSSNDCSSRTCRPNAMHEAIQRLLQWQVATMVMSNIQVSHYIHRAS
jgi:hypothetical protein